MNLLQGQLDLKPGDRRALKASIVMPPATAWKHSCRILELCSLEAGMCGLLLWRHRDIAKCREEPCTALGRRMQLSCAPHPCFVLPSAFRGGCSDSCTFQHKLRQARQACGSQEAARTGFMKVSVWKVSGKLRKVDR